jgi:hypothetical protein
VARAEDDDAGAQEEVRRARAEEELALAAEQRLEAAEHLAAAADVRGAGEEAADADRRRREAEERDRRAHELEQRVRARIDRRMRRERSGLRRYRPGPGSAIYAPRMSMSSPADAEGDLDREIEVIARALDEHGATERRELARLVGARYWGPGRFRTALREAVDEGSARRVSRSTFAPPEDRQGAEDGADGAGPRG